MLLLPRSSIVALLLLAAIPVAAAPVVVETVMTDAAQPPMVAVRGFHYHYAGYEQSEAVLNVRFNTRMVSSEPAVVAAVLRGQAEIGVVSAALLNYLAGQQPEQFARLLLSQRVDSRFSRHLGVSNRSPIDVQTLNALLGCLAANGSLQAIYSRYHLPPPTIPPQPCSSE